MPDGVFYYDFISEKTHIYDIRVDLNKNIISTFDVNVDYNYNFYDLKNQLEQIFKKEGILKGGNNE